MNLYIKNAKTYLNGKFVNANVTVENAKISAVGKSNCGYKEYDCKGNFLCPGFIDIHTHGANGVDVNLANVDDYEKIASFFASKGTTSFMASVLTDTQENTLSALNNIAEYKAVSRNGATLIGVHLEGPFLSKEKKGAMPEELLQSGNSELLEKYISTGVVKYITVAPEVSGNIELIKKFSKRIKFAIGHSASHYETAMLAIKSGAVSSTHTFNGMLGIDRVEPNILGAVIDADIYNEIICDGEHVHQSNIRLLYKAKGNKKIIAITDSIMATGLPNGDYSLGGWAVSVNGDNAFLKDTNIRAGSVLTMDKALKNIMSFLNIDLESAIPMFCENQAKLFSLNKGFIKEGFDADFVILDESYNVVDTIIGGKIFKK